MRRIKIDGVTVDALDEEDALNLRHDSVGRPTRDQETNYARQLEKEEESVLPFTDEDD